MQPRPERRLRPLPLITATLAAALVGTALTASGAAADTTDRLAPLLGTGADAIAGQYIVVLKDGGASAGSTVSAAAAREAQRGGEVRRRFTAGFAGYSAQLNAGELAAVRLDPSVAYVQANQRYQVTGTNQSPATWGLDRVDQRTDSLSNSYYYSNTGSGVDAYVVDTGITTDHPDFTGRVGTGTNTVDSGDEVDCNGHGTHVSGTLGGTRYGVAKKVTLHPVKVLDCKGEGSTESVVAGLEWVAAQHDTNPAVANLSLGSESPGSDPALEDAVQALIDDNVTVVLAAGNAEDDACDYSPSDVTNAIVVGSSTIHDNQSWFSNFGACLDLYAPGSQITSDWIDDENGNPQVNTISGTSMATPHVAGAAALYLQRNPTATPAQVSTALLKASTKDVVNNVPSGTNDLLFAVQKATPPPATTSPSRILSGTALLKGSKICSPDGDFCLTQRSSDGYLVLYRASDNKVIWSNKKAGSWTKMKTTGNLATQNTYGKDVWSTHTSGVGASELRVRDRGYLALVRLSDSKLIWKSNTPVLPA
jgi:hypothetical protein